jgi:hypothetical protein
MTRRPAHRIVASVALAATLALLPATASVAQAQAGRSSGIGVPISGTATAADGTGTVQTLSGMFTIQRFARTQGQIVAVGTLVGTLTSTDPGTSVTSARTFVTQLSMPLQRGNTVTAADVTALATCDILHLVLGPLDLNLLGLVVHLDQVVLDITAVTGAGNLLGNLLCAITGLLDGGGALANIVALLNTLLSLLG